MLLRRRTLTLLSLATAPTLALAQSDKPIEWVIGYAPGGDFHTVTRKLAEATGKSMVRTAPVLRISARAGAA